MRVRVVVEFSYTFDEQVWQLVSELGQAATEGEHQFDELLAAMPARLRRLFRQNVTFRPVGVQVPAAEKGEPSVLAVSSTADGTPATPRAGRPLGLTWGESAIPALTHCRVSLQLSRSDLSTRAAAAGHTISRATIANLELGAVAPRRRHAEALAAALERPLADVLEMLELGSSRVVEV